MFMKIFYGLIALVSVYFLYDSAIIAHARYSAHNVDDTFIQAPPDADLSVVEFLDYSCPSCQQFHTPLKRALERDGRIRYIVKPVAPSHSDEDISSEPSALAIAAARQDKFFEAHALLMQNFRNINDAYITEFASTLELDEQQLRDDLADPEIHKDLHKNLDALIRLKSNSVPTLLLNGRLVYIVNQPVPQSDALQNLFNAARGL